MTDTVKNIPAGVWKVDQAHSTVGFSVPYLMFSKVKGTFKEFAGEAKSTGDTSSFAELAATVSTASIDTGDETRDAHLRSADFFNVDKFPEMVFTSRKVVPTENGNKFYVEGDLTIKEVTKPVSAEVNFLGVGVDAYGNTRAAAEVSYKIDRTDFGLTWNTLLETGGVLVGNEITVTLDIQAILQK